MKRKATILVSLLASVRSVGAFAPPTIPGRCPPRATPATELAMSTSEATAKTTLTDETTWRLRLLFNDVVTEKGRKLDGQLFVVEGNFIEEEGYEPPQGFFRPSPRPPGNNDDEDGSPASAGTALEMTGSRWKLSEDPDDPKDGLWIWGLFKEPLYPYMLLQMETSRLGVPGDDGIPPLKLYAQIGHARSEERGVELRTANLNVRVLERVELPGASVDLYEEEAVGQVSFQPL